MMAVDDQARFIGMRLQSLEFGRNGAHRNQFSAVDAGLLELSRFSHIDQDEFLACVHALLDFLGRNFERERRVGQVLNVS